MANEGFFPTGQVPVFVSEEGVKFSQSNAILHYFGTVTGSYPTDPTERYWADWAIETKNDLWKGDFYMPYFAEHLEHSAIEHQVNQLSSFLTQLNNRLSTSGHHFVSGDKWNIGDVVCFSLLAQIAYNEGLKIPALGEASCKAVEGFSHVKPWFDRMHAVFEEYIKARPVRPL